MEITRTLVAGAMGLALVVGGVGCGQAAEEAAERPADPTTEPVVEQTTEPVGDTDVAVGAGDGDVAVGSGADRPEGWPADLEIVEGLDVLYSTSDTLGLNITGNLDGDLTEISDQVRADVEAAGFTITDDVLEDEGDGRSGVNITATGAEFEARLGITETPNDPQGDILVVYFLEPLPA